MPTARSLIAGLSLAFMVISCTDKGPTEANNATSNSQTPSAPSATRAGKAVLYSVLDQAVPIPNSTLSVGKIQITKFYYEDGKLYVDGGAFTPDGTFISNFSHEEATLTSSGGTTQPTCPILVLDIGMIHLNLLGLDVTLAPVHLNISAQSGSGNLLGNLLCAVANLLNGGSGLATAIQNLITQINAILVGLLGSLTL